MLKLAAKKKVSIISTLFCVLILFCAVSCSFCCSASHHNIDASGLPINLNEEVNDNDIPELEINFYSLEYSNEEEDYSQNPANMGTEGSQNKFGANASSN